MRHLALQHVHLHIDQVQRHHVDNRIATADPLAHLGSPRSDITVEQRNDCVASDASPQLIDDSLLDRQSRTGLHQLLGPRPRDGQLVAGPGVVVVTLGSDRRRDDRRKIVFGHRPLLGQSGKTGTPSDVELTPGPGRQHPSPQLYDLASPCPVLQFPQQLLPKQQLALGSLQLQLDRRRQQLRQGLATSDPVPFLNRKLHNPTVDSTADRRTLQRFDRTDKRLARRQLPLDNRHNNNRRRRTSLSQHRNGAE